MEPDLPPDHPTPAPPAADTPSAGAAGGHEGVPHPPPGAGSGPGGGGGVWAPPFQILRSRHDRKLGGVAGGLAAAAGVDPTLVRLAIVLGCLTGWGILAYLIGWAIIPEEDPAKARYLVPAPERTAKHIRIGLLVVGIIGVLHVVGAILGIVSAALFGTGLFPARLFGLGHRQGFEGGQALLGFFLLIGGCLLLFRRHLPWMPATDSGSGSGGWFAGWAGGSGSSTDAPVPGMALATVDPGSGGGGTTAGGYGGGGTVGGYGPPAPPPGSAGSAPWVGFSARATAAARAARTNGPLLLVRAVGWFFGLWFLAAAVLGGVFWATGAVHIHWPVLPIVTTLAALGVLGYTLVRSRRVGAVIGATALLLVPAGLAAALSRIDGQAGERSVTPIAMSDLEPVYRHAVGSLELDLTRLQLPAGSRTPIHLSMGVGQIEVTVPWDADVETRASVGAGTFDLFGNRQTGVNLKGRTHATGQPGAPVLVISGKAGAGEVIVRRSYEPFTHQALRSGQPVPMQCSPSVTGSLHCTAADGVTQTPALTCVVADGGAALCRPAGEAEPVVDFSNDPGTRHCQVPAGGGEATCTAPIAGKSAGGGAYTCTIPYGGGPATCRPTGIFDPSASPTAPPTPAAPADPNAPASDPNAPAATSPPTPTTPPTAEPGEYRCTVPEGGGPATCNPA
ncbi:MAG: PspC domain-containing protein [Actinobacteria bacterium]|nr:PspC domain-containing protein [Actinomycetota bacterium]